MRRLWDKGQGLDELILEFTVGDDYLLDARLVEFDIRASIAHATMLGQQGLVSPEIVERIVAALAKIGADFAEGKWEIEREQEDCHTAIEHHLGERIGSDAGYVHLGRSRNDQVLTAIRLYLLNKIDAFDHLVKDVQGSLRNLALENQGVPLPGYTHLQRAMPSSVKDWLDAYIAELDDDMATLADVKCRADRNPLGSAAGYGTPGLTLDREQTTRTLGFACTQEPVTAVQLSRGKAEAAMAFALTLISQDLGRLASDMVLLASQEFGFVRMDPSITTGSSIMPQKRNPDVFELVRARSAQASAELMAILAITAKMTSGYHRDLQLIKAPLFRLIDSTEQCLKVMAHALSKVEMDPDRIQAAMDESLYATEEAYRLVQREAISFREAYRRVGESYK